MKETFSAIICTKDAAKIDLLSKLAGTPQILAQAEIDKMKDESHQKKGKVMAMIRNDHDMAFMLKYENIAWYEDGKVRILDRRVYPMKTEFVVYKDHREVAGAIADMVTQSGGPYVAAAMGIALAAFESRNYKQDRRLQYLDEAAQTLTHARPTTVAGMLDAVQKPLKAAKSAVESGGDAADAAFLAAIGILNNTYNQTEIMGEYLASLFPMNGTVMTQCFGESIVGMMLRACRKAGNEIKVICPETRPYYQGARLTASCVRDMDFDVTVITDNMPAYVMGKKKVDVFTSAADMITIDGHIVNKVGTFQIALAAHHWGIPYYVTGQPHRAHPTMDTVVIEERDPNQAMESLGVRTTMEGVKGYYPAFDVTPPKLCDGVVSEKGIYSPFDLASYFKD